MSDALIFDENFRITSINSQKYDRVSRIEAVQNDCRFTLDINSELYPCHEEENINLALASTLNIDGKEDPKDEDGKSKGGWREFREGEMSLADNYDYVCYGKVYKFDEGDGEKIQVYASFGGLLLFIEGPHKRLSGLRVDYVYLLLKK